jgi:hypothetical protein
MTLFAILFVISLAIIYLAWKLFSSYVKHQTLHAIANFKDEGLEKVKRGWYGMQLLEIVKERGGLLNLNSKAKLDSAFDEAERRLHTEIESHLSRLPSRLQAHREILDENKKDLESLPSWCKGK